ncbi:DUF5452 domain-containing protein [Mycoplasmoides alvi]|uniref:DUF5452 domain-containing protein n=1 Tax=Mycoplasmoides alvi TaxID=78580 RepID=UPI00051ACD1E|nr:DUF5452 domain-containing protein [Mycoplasmoides alvi]
MSKKIKQILLWITNGIMLSTTITLAIITIVSTQKKNVKENNFNNNESSSNLNDSGNNNNNSSSSSSSSNNTNTSQTHLKEEYPESSIELQNLTYPFGNPDSYCYMYANIHSYLYNNPEWDNLISYQAFIPNSYNNVIKFDIDQNLLFKNIKSWITKSIYQHPFFKNKNSTMTLEIDYKVNYNEQNILLNVLWYFDNDYSKIDNLPKRYWDQIIVELSKNV